MHAMEGDTMILGDVMERFLQESPVCVMVRATLENVFAQDKLNAVFEAAATEQYTRELTFSTVVDLMSLVVCRVQPSVHAAFNHRKEQMPVTIRALYDKLNLVEPATSRALVRHTAEEVRDLIHQFGGERGPLLPGHRCRILDGNHLGSTEHRLDVLRHVGGGALPGLALAVLDPQTMTIDDVIPCEDGHTQECTLLGPLLETTRPHDVWIADRHFCTSGFLFGLWRRQGCFVIRQHAGHLVWREQGPPRAAGRCASGKVEEQELSLTDPETGEERTVRRITVRLQQATRDGDKEVHILTNLPRMVAAAPLIAELYCRRWTLETAFQELTMHLRCELNTMGYPSAALFGFCVAVACYNILATVKGALRAAHGQETIDAEVSNYYLTEEVSATYRGMMIALPPPEWKLFAMMPRADLAKRLKSWAKRLNLSRYPKHKRGPKKPVTRRPRASRQHVATARLLQSRHKQATG
jgi:hypothetical protein